MTQSFEEKVRSLTPKEIVMECIVNALENPAVKVDMDSFGKTKGGACYGCAATNAVAKLAGVTFTPDTIYYTNHAEAVGASAPFVSDFENAIDCLRGGHVSLFNLAANRIGMAMLPFPNRPLPLLNNWNYQSGLNAYRAYAEEQC